MIDVSSLMNDPDFASRYTVIRRSGTWEGTRFVVGSPVTLECYGPVQPATQKELNQLPEGDRHSGTMKFFCKPPNTLNITGDGNVSDEIIYNGQRYKIFAVMDWTPHGYVRAFAYCIGGVRA
jgi:hypothetical protein